MKASFFILASAFFASCSLFYPELTPGSPRENQTYSTAPDTTFLVSAVAFADSYDWQKDSGRASVPCKVLLFRNDSKFLELPAGSETGIGISPDQHHIIDGELYTEYTDSRGSQIKKNGESVLWWEEQEKLLGLLSRDGVLHSLGQLLTGDALVYRQDGLPVMRIDGAVACGGFGCNGYGPNGALYEASGQVCFSYITQEPGHQEAVLVQDGIPEVLLSLQDADIMDARMTGMVKSVLYERLKTYYMLSDNVTFLMNNGGLMWKDASMIEYDGQRAIAGKLLQKKGNPRLAIGLENEVIYLDSGSEYVYCDGPYCPNLGEVLKAHKDCYFFRRDCAVQLGAGLAVALTPKNEPPFLEYCGKTIKYNINGYLTGVAVKTSK